MVDISVGPFSVQADVRDLGVHVKVKLDFKVLDFEWEANLSANDPGISFSTGDVAKFSGSISVSIDDATGNLNVNAKICIPVYDPPFSIGQECEGFNASLHVLPKGGLCMLAQGVTKQGLDWFGVNYPNNVPTCHDLMTFRQNATPEIIEAIKSYKDITAGGQSLVEAMCNSLGAYDAGMLNRIRGVSPDTLEKIMSGVVTNAQVNDIYPGLAAKFGLTAEAGGGDISHDLAARDAHSVILEVAEEIGVALGIEIGLATAIGAVVGAIVAVVGVTGGIVVGGVALTPVILVGLVIFLAILLIAGIVLVPLIAIVVAVSLVLVEILVVEDIEPRRSLLN